MKMKKLLQAAALLGVAVWASASRPVFAFPLCDSIHGTSCTTTGAKTSCTTSDNLTSSCTCTAGHTWRCLL
jgi:hypothetical protein